MGSSHLVLATLIVLQVNSQIQPAQVIYHVTEENQTKTLVGNAYVDSGLSSRMKQATNVQFGFVSPTEQTKNFRIEDWSGAIYTTGALDRETICSDGKCPVNLDVAVQLVSGASRDLVSIIRVEVFVDDINDNAPQFQSSSASLSIVESTPIDTTVGLYAATDADIAGDNSLVTYEMFPPNGFGKFGMEVVKNWDGSTDVGLVLKEQLDRETQSFYQIRLTAKDGGQPALTGTLTIDVSVTDSNDHIPVFTKPVYNVTIWENVTLGTEILRLSTNDQDIGLNGQVTYKFNARSLAKVGPVFRIESSTGAVIVNGAVDFETASIYQLTVEASDNGTPAKSSQSAIVVHVLDVNDCPPKISFNLLAGGDHAIVSELAKPGTFVAHISVSDKDVAAVNKNIDCHIQDALFDLKKLSNQEFKVILSGSVDRERMAEYQVDVSCRDFGVPPLEATTPLKVVVKDENDHDPYFTSSTYSKTIQENYPLGRPIVTVSAKDGDIGKNSQISYIFGSGNHKNLSVNSETGVVTATGLLDREQSPIIYTQILAHDNGSPQRTATASLTLTLLDLNDEPPSFVDKTYSFSVFENRPMETRVGNVKATDPDLKAGGQVFYTLMKNAESLGNFNISRSDGLIFTNKVFDRESKSQYKLLVAAIDKGNPAMTSFVEVTVSIKDENDHFPVITFPTGFNNSVDILHSADVDTFVTSVQAYDLDKDQNSQLTYFIQSGNSERLFKIDEKNGNIVVAQRIKSYLAGTIEMMIGVRDNGTPMKSSWESLFLHIHIDNSTALEILEDEGSGNIVIVVSVITATIILSVAIIIGIVVIRRQDAKKHIYRAKSEERKIIRRRGSVNSKSDQSNTSSSSEQSKKDVSLTLTDDSQAPLNASTFTQVTSFSTFKGQMLSYISSIDQKTLECPQACSSWLTSNTVSPDLKQDTIGDKQAEINKLAYEQQPPPVSHTDRAYLQIIHEETETKSMLKALNDTLSDVSSETMVTSDSGRGGSEEDVHFKTADLDDRKTSRTSRPLSTLGNYQQRQSYHGRFGDGFGQLGESYGRFPPAPSTESVFSPKKSNFPNMDYEKNINVSEGSIIDNTTVRMSELAPPRPPRYPYHNTPSQQLVDVPSCIQSNLPHTQDTQPLGFLSRLHMKSPSAQMCSPSLVGKNSYFHNGDTFRSNKTTNMYDATTVSERCGVPYSVGDIDDGGSDCTTDIKDDDATTTSGSYTINPDELCNEIDELFFKDIIV